MSGQLVLIAGAFGHGNVGDDSIALAQCRLLREIEPEVRIVLLGGEPRRLRQTLGEDGCYLSWRSPGRVARLVGLVRRCDAVLIGGGGLLSDRLHFYRPYVVLALVAEALRKPVMFYGVGAYPPSTITYRLMARAALGRAAAVTVRDAFSAESIAATGLRRHAVVAADPAITLRPPANAAVAVREDDRPLIGVSLRPMYDAPSLMPDPRELAAKLARCLDAIGDATQGRLTLFPMHFGTPDDDALFDDLVIRRMRRPVVVELKARQRPQDVLAGIAQCDVVLGMRLHANILAAAAGVPSIALAYDPKIREFMRQLGAEDRVVEMAELEPDDLAGRVATLLDERESASLRIQERVEKLSMAARSCALTAARLAGCSLEAVAARRITVGVEN